MPLLLTEPQLKVTTERAAEDRAKMNAERVELARKLEQERKASEEAVRKQSNDLVAQVRYMAGAVCHMLTECGVMAAAL